MKTLVLNCGSSSIKYKLFDMTAGAVMAQGGIERIGIPGTLLKLTAPDGEKVVMERKIAGHEDGIAFILSVLTDGTYGCIRTYDGIGAVGHRVVHGGEQFADSVLVNDEVIARVKECSELAPLHNPANLEGIYAIRNILPGTPQVAVFDTAFHQSMPGYAYMYGLPYEVYAAYGVRRYGFHGTSHRYVSRRACDMLGVPYRQQRIITAHIGNGGSITAIRNGKSIDTSMGLTPVEGLLMGTRCGDVDAGALTFVMNKLGLDAAGLSDLINKQCGVWGISGVSSDMRELEKACSENHPRALLAMEMYIYRIRKYVGAYAAALGGLDMLVFTGGVGENQCSLRAAVCRDMEYMGIRIDEAANSIRGREAVISAPDSKVAVLAVPTDEEYMIASDTQTLLQRRSTPSAQPTPQAGQA
jgi:acetate kinase